MRAGPDFKFEINWRTQFEKPTACGVMNGEFFAVEKPVYKIIIYNYGCAHTVSDLPEITIRSPKLQENANFHGASRVL